MKPYYVAHIFYLPLGYAISLINQGYSTEEAYQLALSKFAYCGKRNNKRLKDFDRNQFHRHLIKFINTKNAVLVRKSKRYHR